MRSGNRRGVTLALGLACGLALAAVITTPARAQFHTIPRLVPAVDVNTGGPYYAPPVPYGHYAGKNLDGHLGKVKGLLHGGLLGHGKGCGPCGGCGGKGCGACGGTGDACGGNGSSGLFAGHGHGGGFGHGHGNGDPCGDPGCGGGRFHKGHGHGVTVITAGATVVSATAQSVPSSQAASPVCVDPGCGLLGRHGHKGCGHGLGDPCGGTGKGCGLGKGHGLGDPCGGCGGKGCGLCGGKGLGGLCNLCGGLGCSACSKVKGVVHHLLGRDKIKWFVGAGGPIPLTPGYTPYVNVTRSPRDFFAFPPMTP